MNIMDANKLSGLFKNKDEKDQLLEDLQKSNLVNKFILNLQCLNKEKLNNISFDEEFSDEDEK